MVRVTDHFKIAGDVPFLNVHVDRDNRLFIDPSAIRTGTSAHARRADGLLVNFFAEVLTCARSTDALAQRKGLRLLQSLHEPNETRLGYSEGYSRGHAFADEMGGRLWEEIRINRTLMSTVKSGASVSMQQTVMSRLEDVPLFIKRVDRDMISDLTTRVIFEALADFTADMVKKYPALAVDAATVEHPVWNPGAADFVDKQLTLPSVKGKQLLLVPKAWVYWRLVMDPIAFYNRYATSTIQDEQTTFLSNGRRNAPSKKGIKSKNRDRKGTNIRQAVKYAEQHGRDLVGEYRSEIDETFEPLTAEELDQRIGE